MTINYPIFSIMLTKRQIERQDFVDNQVFELLQRLLPASKTMKWDIEVIGSIRDAIRKEFVDKKEVMSEAQFYPYINPFFHASS